MDAAFSSSIAIADHEDVALHAPLGTPGVFHFVVVLSLEVAITDGQNCMVQVCLALSIEYASFVHLKRESVALDRHCRWLLNDCSHQNLFLSRCYFCAILNLENFIPSLIIGAFLVHLSVGVFGLSGNTMIPYILEGGIGISSVAPHVSVVAGAVE